MSTKPMQTDQLLQFWNSQSNLTEQQWQQFLQLLYRYLASMSLSPPMQPYREDLLQGFITDKVLTANGLFIIERIETIKTLFGNYVKDYQRYLMAQVRSCNDTISLDEQSEGEDGWSEPADRAAGLVEQLAQLQLLQTDGELPLWQQCQQWLLSLEQWMVIYLALHLCQDEAERRPLSLLAQQFQIKSYDYKARLLGITGSKDGFYVGYSKTVIGQWLLRMGLDVERAVEDVELQQQLLEYMKILCLVALEYADAFSNNSEL